MYIEVMRRGKNEKALSFGMWCIRSTGFIGDKRGGKCCVLTLLPLEKK